MGAPEIIAMVQAPHNERRVARLALEWPSLAAALADLFYDNETRPPTPLRVAHQAVSAEGYVGDTAVAALVRYHEIKE
jgi:hypothetical protein